MRADSASAILPAAAIAETRGAAARLVVAALAAAGLVACTPSPAPPALPPANGQLDYQLGGAHPPPSGVDVVVRDRTEAPADVYSICYVNGFQSQPDETEWWLDEHPDLVLRDGGGEPVVDPDWPDEVLLDVTSAERRAAIAAVVGEWIDGCAADGFEAVEIDNLDTYARSDGRISEDDAVAHVRVLRDRAHAAGLPIGQKNSVELLGRQTETGLDFAVAEECTRYDECGAYTEVYGDQVYVIEYRRADFEEGCAAHPELSIVLRDRDLRPAGRTGYVYDAC